MFPKGPRGPGFGPPFGPPFGFMMKGFKQAGKGDVRASVLVILEEESLHGYEIIKRLERATDGAWKPSPGSMYPTLQMLEDEGLLSSEKVSGKNVFTLTDEGKKEVAHLKSKDDYVAPWERQQHGPFNKPLFGTAMELMGKLREIGQGGDGKKIKLVETKLKVLIDEIEAIQTEDQDSEKEVI